MMVNPTGEHRAKKREDRQGGGANVSLSGGDERSEPESLTSNSSFVRTLHDREQGRAAERRGAPPAAGLPCLSSNNCTKTEVDKLNVLTGAHKRTAFMVAFEIQCLVREFGIERIGFFTLTFKDHVTDLREAQQRFRSLRAHVIVKRYRRAIGVWERHKSGRIHFHLVVVLDYDIRSGANFHAFKRKDYRSANSALRAEWAFWRETCPKYRFGRHELMPVKSTAEGIARYVGKYISKHVTQRLAEDKGARVVRFIGYKAGTRRACCRFAWNTDNGWLWRQKLARFAARRDITNLDHMKRRFGRRWAYRLQEQILAERLENGITYPSRNAAEREWMRCLAQDALKDRWERTFAGRPGAISFLLRPRNYDNSSPVWVVPKWVGERTEIELTSPEAVREFEARAREMRRFALMLPPVTVEAWDSWMDYATKRAED